MFIQVVHQAQFVFRRVDYHLLISCKYLFSHENEMRHRGISKMMLIEFLWQPAIKSFFIYTKFLWYIQFQVGGDYVISIPVLSKSDFVTFYCYRTKIRAGENILCHKDVSEKKPTFWSVMETTWISHVSDRGITPTYFTCISIVDSCLNEIPQG